jgi:hypothetical protein
MATIYHFPDLDTLRLAVTSGVVPPAVSLSPAVAGLEDGGHILLQPAEALPRAVQTGLARLGVQPVRAKGELKAEQVCCWLQLLPVQRDPSWRDVSRNASAAVLFELPGPELLPDLVGEMLRLGNDRQSYQWMKPQDVEGLHVLLRVVGPPYFSLLRALDRDGKAAAPRAYVERAPRVWVEIGHTHPLVEQIRPAAGQILLMRPPRDWLFLKDVPFRDIYEILEFALPNAPIRWAETELGKRITVPVRLAPATSTDPAELWVLRDRAAEEVDELVRTADDRLIDRLSFAVGERDGCRTIAIGVRPGKWSAPPVLSLRAVEFRPYLKLKNLFVPCGTRLQPPLRRDAVRKLLAEDPAQVVWLYPEADGRFTPESLPDEAFRPLRDWVEYVLDQDRQALETWVEAARFDFEPFVCKEDQPPAKPKPPRRSASSERSPASGRETQASVPLGEPVAKVAKKPPRARKGDADEFADLPREEPSELRKRLDALERQFLDFDGPLDAPERQALWPELARLNAALENPAEAAVCWLNALWESDERSEGKLSKEFASRETQGQAADLDRLLGLPEPSLADLRGLVAHVVWAATRTPPPKALVQRLPRIRAFLEEHEERLAVRAVWLAWTSLVKLSAGDVLGLARARDRLLERLLEHGLSPDNDLPGFMRFAEQKSGERSRVVRERILRLRNLGHRWITTVCGEGRESDHTPTSAYADLMFAFGLAWLGETNDCRGLRRQAEETLRRRDEVHWILLDAFSYRIQQLVEGKAPGGPLPDELIEKLNRLQEYAQDSSVPKEDPRRLFRYKIDRLRQHSRILEPNEKTDPYHHARSRHDELGKELSLLRDVHDRDVLVGRFKELIKDKNPLQARLRTYSVALELAGRLGEAFTAEILGRLVSALGPAPEPPAPVELIARAELLDRALFAAAHYDRPEYVQAFVSQFLRLLESKHARGGVPELDTVAGQCFRGLRKLGLRDEIDQLLKQMAALVLRGERLESLRQRQEGSWPAGLRTLLHVASGWLYFGRNDEAIPILDEARDVLFEGELSYQEKTSLACTYLSTLGHASSHLALPRMEELFGDLGKITDTFTTSSHYFLLQLDVVEAAVQAIISDEFALGAAARRWLDDDEYLVRRRIHRDVRTLMAQAGV